MLETLIMLTMLIAAFLLFMSQYIA